MRTRTLLLFGLLLGLLLGNAPQALAQDAQESTAYNKELTYGVNFNSNAGLIGGASVRSLRVITDDWARFWMLEGVEVKHPKELRVGNPSSGGIYVQGKSNYLFVLRPTFGVQRMIFRKAPESGVQVSAIAGAGPSVGLLLPYYIYYNYTEPNARPNATPDDIRAEQFDPNKHSDPIRIYDRAPLFQGISEVKPNVGAHVRGALNFEYGRYRDAVAGLEAGVLLEAYTNSLTILRDRSVADSKLNNQMFSSVYLTLYIGHRN
ncbi:hypothetical protein F0P96_09600 [Hymenobacter busanensis]|uniref:Uncharacterized protein n=1 Tax=Hymenobacter busanensis TaxID=2607656 RepID=A0A7L4ZXW3_9BACT|nr:hypothetical protein [Hymenobacter busanensis]KAA9333222.1 hypothetical protein F0P96_09600 [Hymenobacter busanensis]QHJ08101.1 hypothetical protein GUY19_12720 [Hymenobacter busanensis]